MTPPKEPYFELEHVVMGWWWRLRAANGRVLATSGVHYDTRREAVKSVEQMLMIAPGAGERPFYEPQVESKENV